MSGTNNSPALPELTDKLIDRLYRSLLLSPNPRRDRAILQLFLHFGCTVKDILALTVDDLDLNQGRIRWHRDGRAYWRPLPPGPRGALKDYCERERRGEINRLFTTRLGHPISRSQVMQIFRFLQRESGLDDLNPNTMRERHRHLLFQPEQMAALLSAHRKPVRQE